MTEHTSGDVVGIFADKIQVHVTSDHAEQSNSYTTVSRRGKPGEAENATVTVEAGRTFFQYRGDLFMFDGVSYRPNSDYRDDEDPFADGEVDMVFPDGFHPDAGHRFNPNRGTFTLSDFVDMLESGELEPAENPDGVHD